MGVRKAMKRPQTEKRKQARRSTSRGGARARAVNWRNWLRSGLLVPGLLATGVLIGMTIGFGLASLPPAPVLPPAALDLPVETAAPLKVAEEAVPPTSKLSSNAAKTTSQPAQPPALPRTTATQPAFPQGQPALQLQVEPEVQAAALPSAGIPAEVLPLWRRNAAAYRDPGVRPLLAIVLDDVGVAPQQARAALDLPAPLVLSIMTYADKGGDLAREARRRGHEVMVHMPMQPLSGSVDPGPEALSVGLPADEIRRRVDWGLARFDGYVGFNNHMGSRFTQNTDGMRIVLEEARQRGLLFLDSKTISNSVGEELAREMGVAHIGRDVFLDDTVSEAAVERQLAAAESIARKRGYAVAIGHPHPATIAVLKRSLPELAARGIAVVPLTAIVKRRDGLDG
ncbi:hypothetical protein A8950_3873 [Dongia mobilis]|uniref:Divergent polysaccharide deacetylase family protein n=1 Tax=Dongia mobilis TaxID=578943 RepID=A0A4R6WIJ9_9PROT|nr:divergent polysaccharide deacetylase family protein [Dongia mobilis]TDQ77718.1 hypothetical protein A8950_3873 [Dongia mobilis]